MKNKSIVEHYKQQELWNRQCISNVLLAAELYDIDGISQDGLRTIHKLKENHKESSEEETSAEAKDTTEYFDSQEGAFFTGSVKDVNEKILLEEIPHYNLSCCGSPATLFGSYARSKYDTALSFDAKKVLKSMFQEAWWTVLFASQLYNIDGSVVK